MTTSLVGDRKPVAIDDGLIRAGSQTAAFDRSHPETLLRNYLRLIRRARSQQRAPEISLRREDVEALATYLDVTAESVLHRLATLMGSSRTQRTTMLAAFASGALLVGLAGSVAATSPLDTSGPHLADGAVAAAVVDDVPAELSVTGPDSDTTANDVGPETPTADSPTSRRPSVVIDDTGAGRAPTTASLVQPPIAPTATSTSAPGSGAVAGSRPSTRGSAAVPDGDVALVSPVLPASTDDVAVGQAVVPPNDPVAPGNDDASVQPPVTETTVAPADDIPEELPPVDDDTVAVGPPPVPTTLPATTTAPPTTTTTPTTAPPTTVPVETTP